LRRLTVDPSDDVRIQVLRYGAVSLIALMMDFGGLIFMTEALRMPYLAAATSSFVLGLVIVYLLSTRWVFRPVPRRGRVGDVLAFALIGVVGLVINDAIMWFVTSALHTPYGVGKVCAIGVVFGWNFAARRRLYSS
jgi:putative flippase GtrA